MVETWIGEFLASKPGSCLVATKGGRHIEPGRDNEKDFSRDFIQRDVEGSLTRLKTSNVFLYQLHNPSRIVIEKAEVFEVLEDLRSRGFMQWYGVSIDEPGEGLAAIETCRRNGFPGLAALQVVYSVIAKAGGERLFRVASEAGIGIIAREVMARGFLTDKYTPDSDLADAPPAVRKLLTLYGKTQLVDRAEQVRRIAAPLGMTTAQAALCFAMQNPFVTVTLAGINRACYLDEDFGAIALSLPSQVLSRLRRIPDAEKC